MHAQTEHHGNERAGVVPDGPVQLFSSRGRHGCVPRSRASWSCGIHVSLGAYSILIYSWWSCAKTGVAGVRFFLYKARTMGIDVARVVPALRVHGLVFEVLLIGLTWKNTTATLRDTVVRTPFSTMFLRNGTFVRLFLGVGTGSLSYIRRVRNDVFLVRSLPFPSQGFDIC